MMTSFISMRLLHSEISGADGNLANNCVDGWLDSP